MSEMSDAAARLRRSRIQLALIFLIALASLGGSYLMFYVAQEGGVWGTINNGAFVQPPVQVTDLSLVAADDQPVLPGETWSLWVVAPDGCSAPCRDAVHQLRQLHALLNKDANRVRRALVTTAASSDTGWLVEYPKLQLYHGNLSGLQQGVYIVDPIGNLVFWYPLEEAGKPVLEDLKRLLKVSQIG